MTLPVELKQEAIRLRVEERLSIDEIRELTGMSVGTLSVLLRAYPLAADEVKSKMSDSALRNNPSRKYNPEPSKYAKMVEGEELSTARKGQIAELAVLFRLGLLGYKVWREMGEGSKVDWLVSRDSNKYIRLQVKWARRCELGRPAFAVRNGEHGKIRYISREHCDFVVGYDLECDTAYVVPVELCEGMNTKSCDEQYAEAWHLLGI